MVWLRRLLYLLLSVLVLSALLVAAVFLLKPRIPLGGMTGPVASLLSYVSGRPQQLKGTIFLTLDRVVIVEVLDTRVLLTGKNDQRLVATIGLAKLGFDIFSLVDREIRFAGIALADTVVAISPGMKSGVAGMEVATEKNRPFSFPHFATGEISLDRLDLTVQKEGKNGHNLYVRHASGTINTWSTAELSIDAEFDNKALFATINSTKPPEAGEVISSREYKGTLTYLNMAVSLTGLLDLDWSRPKLRGLFSFSDRQHRQLSGEYRISLDSASRELSAGVTLPNLDMGILFDLFQLGIDPLDFTVSQVAAEMTTKGDSLDAIRDNLEVEIKAGAGTLDYRDPNTGAILPVAIERLQLSAKPEESMRLVFDGRIGNTPLNCVIERDDKRGLGALTAGDASVKAVIKAADAQWQLSGTVPLPLSPKGMTLNSRLRGQRFSSLSDLLRVKLPDMGPYELSGIFRIEKQGYRLDELSLAVGESRLGGHVFVDTKSSPPFLQIELESPHIQLDDLRTAWANGSVNEEPFETSGKPEFAQHAINRAENRDVRFLTDQQVLDSYDARVRLKAEEVMSGKDYLGSGSLVIEQSGGKFHLDPLEINLPGGSTVNFDFHIEPARFDRHFTLELRADEFDYGIIGRHLKPGSDIKGIVSLNFNLDSVTPDYKSIMKHASGYLDVVIKPERLHAGVIDLWAINLVSYLLPVMNPDNKSKINCLAGRFNIKDGVLREDDVLIDTSRIQVKGKVGVDFKKRRVEAYLRPVPKRPQFYSLATPIVISGEFGDFKVGPSRGGVFGTLIRLATSYIVVPLQWIILNKVPKDDTASCLNLMQKREVKIDTTTTPVSH